MSDPLSRSFRFQLTLMVPLRVVLAFVLVSLGPWANAAEPNVNFANDVAPILQEHCVRCHSPGNNKGDVSLATDTDLKANEYIIAGDPDGSYLIELVTGSGDEPPEMPKDGTALSAEDVSKLRDWISAGAAWPEAVVIREKSRADRTWWSLQPLASSHPRIEEEKNDSAATTSSRPSIDLFVLEKLAEKHLTLSEPADRRTLIRRATYDLTGLPPTPEELEAFVADPSPKAYELLIERLLESPHYGERWGRHWLDVVRFGESIGYERNVIVNDLWPFRDYVIRSINEDKPFDQFIREHIAGDVIGNNDPKVAIGSAFLVAGPYDDVGNQDAEQAAQIRANTLDEIIRSTTEAFLGMTLGCARCHDHKFDPITQEDYYGLYATFAGVRHGRTTLATPAEQRAREEALAPLTAQQSSIEESIDELEADVLARANKRLADFEAGWTRSSVDRTGTEERFARTTAKWVRLVCESTDSNPESKTFKIDEFEVWSSGNDSRNVALSSAGAKATGKARVNEDFPGVYGPHLAIDGKSGERFISASDQLTIELSEAVEIDRIVFSSARGEANPEHGIFGGFPADYRLETSINGESWTEVAHGRDREPANDQHRNHRLLHAEMTSQEEQEKRQQRKALVKVKAAISKVPKLTTVWLGTRNEEDAAGPFHLFIGGSPKKLGSAVVPTSLSALEEVTPSYRLGDGENEAARRLALAEWITHPENPLTARVLVNRIWHYHFGSGIVDTPSDFGYMGGKPTHPELLDFLANKLKDNGWRMKELHRMIMLSDTYRQSSQYQDRASKVDGDSRLLWRFPPRRLSAEEVRDTMLHVAGKLQTASSMAGSVATGDGSGEQRNWSVPDGGPGFRLYHFMQDNVCTYKPLDKHGPETYRRAVYHQNARASVVDLMTEFDQPDCTFSTPKRAETTTPLQALTMLNHSFTLDMATAFAERLRKEAGANVARQVTRAYELCYSRIATPEEIAACRELVQEHGLAAMCRVLLNTSELIYVR